jgi:hypothetical protein
MNQRLQGALATTTGASGSRLSDDGVSSLPSPLVQLERWVCWYQTFRKEEALLVQRVGELLAEVWCVPRLRAHTFVITRCCEIVSGVGVRVHSSR